MHPQLRPFAAALCSCLVAASAAADVVVLSATKDATIFNDGDGSHASGTWKQFFAGLSGTNTPYPVRRALIEFDVAGAIPAGATVQSVQLKLYMSQTTAGTKVLDLRRLTSGWNEGPTAGTSGAGGPSQTGDATWLHTFYNTQFWATQGGDFLSTVSASANVGGSGFYTWGSTANLVADVQAWIDNPATQHGWILRGPESGTKSAKRFEARNSDVIAWRPELTVTFLPPGPTSYCTAKTNSQGCVPAVGSSGTPDADAGSGFVISESNTLNQKSGLLFYGTNGANAIAFQGGTLCVQAPLIRTPVQTSGGNPPPDDCSGSYGYDFNVRIASGADPALVAGAQVWAQFWSRDPADPFTTNLSNGLHFTILP